MCENCYRYELRRGRISKHAKQLPDCKDWLSNYLSDFPETDACVEWPFAQNLGYGVINIDRRVIRVTRIVLSFYLRRPLEGLEACHSCDNKACINPRHLFAGTHGDNMADAAKKSLLPQAKLTPESVAAIRVLAGRKPQREIARMFGVSQRTVACAIHRYNWKHVT